MKYRIDGAESNAVELRVYVPLVSVCCVFLVTGIVTWNFYKP